MNRFCLKHSLLSVLALCLLVCFLSPAVVFADELQTLRNCVLVETEWSDGDSFRVQDEQGKQYTVRLYGVDCLEYHVQDTTDARRLRAQRRYFGISQYGGSAEQSILNAKKLGKAAKIAALHELDNPFTVHTAFADARGDGRYKRYYAFITTNKGEDLGEKLVRLGLARAFGVYRQTPDGRSREELREWLKDIELQAAMRGAGIWATSDWNSLPSERRDAREEVSELALATGNAPLGANDRININTAPRDELMRLPGIGEVLANRIIERRPYKTIESITEVEGIGKKIFQQMQRNLKVVD